jgi:hypothetical protein
MWCAVIWTRSARKMEVQASITTCCNCELVDEEDLFIPLTIEVADTLETRCERESHRGRSRLKTTIAPLDCPDAATHRSNNSIVIYPRLHRPAPSPLRHNQQAPDQSVQTPGVNSSFLNGMFKAVATAFQQIMTELNGAESGEDSILAVTTIVLKLLKQNGCI